MNGDIWVTNRPRLSPGWAGLDFCAPLFPCALVKGVGLTALGTKIPYPHTTGSGRGSFPIVRLSLSCLRGLSAELHAGCCAQISIM